jgi:hypothetical protein
MAHAAARSDAAWWPMEEESEGVFWPEGAPREETLEAFVTAYVCEGYVSCGGAEPEPGFEKIAIYVDVEGKPAHAARQLPSGFWTSKLGDWEEHRTQDAGVD